MDEKTRIEKIMQYEAMTSGQFALEIGIQNSTLSHILNNRNNPSLDVMKKILNRFPSINADWLILGQGSMFRQELNSQMPTLFSFEDENNSLSGNSSNNLIENSEHTFSSKEHDTARITPERTAVPISKKNETDLIKEKRGGNSGEIKQTFSDQTFKIQDENVHLKIEAPLNVEKKVTKIILYYTDNTFQEFESK
jgi:transcriptional regulator with XRE-family HTH domain